MLCCLSLFACVERAACCAVPVLTFPRAPNRPGRSQRLLHYKNNIFHRIIPGFMAQGGDITRKNGTGGESIYGMRFQDENFILSHSTAGIVSMANAGPDSNTSQFFITFGAQSQLDGRHVVFGRVVRGLAVLCEMESVATDPNTNKPRLPVTIVDCGEIPDVPLYLSQLDKGEDVLQSDAEQKLAERDAREVVAMETASLTAERVQARVEDSVREGLKRSAATAAALAGDGVEADAAGPLCKKPRLLGMDPGLLDDCSSSS